MTHWANRFEGLPWKPGGRDLDGVDCWGLATLIYRDVAGIALDPLNGLYVTAEEREDIAAIVDGEMRRGPWRRVERPGELDIVLFRCFGLQSHVGIVAARGVMLHALFGTGSVMTRFDDGRWRPRFAGAFRHASRP